MNQKFNQSDDALWLSKANKESNHPEKESSGMIKTENETHQSMCANPHLDENYNPILKGRYAKWLFNRTQNHPTQGLQEMTLDLSRYSDTVLTELQNRIEEEKKKRERQVPFLTKHLVRNGLQSVISSHFLEDSIRTNLYYRLSAEAKLRAAGGGSLIYGARMACLFEDFDGKVKTFIDNATPTQGAIYFNSEQQALSAYNTLTPDEQAAIFEFGDE